MQHNEEFLALVNAAKPTVQEVDIAHVAQQIADDPNLVVIDVREDSEWQQGHIPTAIHLARGIIERDIENKVPNKDTEIVLYCAGGFRSILAAANIQKMGYKRVYSMIGGIRGWINSGKITLT